jgi:Flp pilus assembly protein TadG
MKSPQYPTHSPRRAGTAAVELAMALPVLLLIVLGCVDYGRVMYDAIALENAVGAGSDYAATHRFTDYTKPTWETRVRERISDEMQGVPHFDSASLTVAVTSETGPDDGVRVTITATYPFHPVVDWPGLPNSVTLRHRVSAWQYR